MAPPSGPESHIRFGMPLLVDIVDDADAEMQLLVRFQLGAKL